MPGNRDTVHLRGACSASNLVVSAATRDNWIRWSNLQLRICIALAVSVRQLSNKKKNQKDQECGC